MNGATLYLVSACGSAEEFVAAFRRYADRTGLFIPSSAPLPAGRRGRLALTLKDGGVMIEGEAEIVQSSAKPTVLYGRPGMTIKFLAPDDPSKVVIGELEKARLAMKPAPPSVPPRPAEIPAEPRPVVPAVGGRIDAANSLAECIVIGDPAGLRDTSAPSTGAPRAHSDSISGKKFVVPLIPGAAGERARTPSTPPEASRPKTPTTPPDQSARPRTTTTPPDPSSKPVPVPTNLPPSKPISSAPSKPVAAAPSKPVSAAASSKMTSIGFPIIDRLPADVAPVVPIEPQPSAAPPTPAAPIVPETAPKPKAKFGARDENPLLKTMPGVAMPHNATTQMSAASLLGADEEATTIGEAPEGSRTRQDIAAESEPTNLSSPPPVPSLGIPAAISNAPASGATSGKTAPTPSGGAPSGAVPRAAVAKTPSGATAAPAAVAAKTPSGATAAPNAVVGKTPSDATPIAAAAKTPSGPVAATPEEPAGILAPPPPPAPTPAPPRAPAAPLPSLQSSSTKHQQKATSIGFPVVRTPFETQPLGLVPPADPQAPIVPKSDGARTPSAPAARGKNPTRPPMVPRQPTPVAPVPVVLRSPARNAPIVEEEPTEMTSAPPSPPAESETAAAHPAYTDAAKAADVATTRSGGMRASEILAAIPSADWTMAPDASQPTVVPSTGKVAIPEPTPAPGPIPKGPPTGDWTISLDPEAPEAGWSAPAKVPPPPPKAPKGGNPDVAVASEKPIHAIAHEEKPVNPDDAKIEIDPTLMQPLTPMPADDADANSAVSVAGSGFDIDGPSPFAAPPPSHRAGTEPLAGIAALGAVMRAPSAPQPLVGSRPRSGSTPIVNEPAPPAPPTGSFASSPPSFAAAPAYSIPPSAIPNTPAEMFEPQAAMFGFPNQPELAAAAARRKKFLIIGAAVIALVAGFAVVMVLAGGKKSTSAGTAPKQGSAEVHKTVPDVGSAAVAPAVVVPVDAAAAGSADVVETGSAGSAGSAAAAVVEPAGSNAPTEPAPPANDGMCTVSVASVPTGADIVIAKEKRGTTPADIEVPCGKAVTIAVKKPKFDTADREITPKAGKPAKLTLKLPKPSVMVKVTSTPMGATITVGGKSMGVTPAKIRMTIGEPASVVLSKPGYANDTTKITPRGNAPSITATLKKKR